jgi:hypothetical protein
VPLVMLFVQHVQRREVQHGQQQKEVVEEKV